MSVWAVVGNFFALLILTIVFFLFAMRVGRTAFFSAILSLYAGYALYTVFPYTDMLVASGGTPLLRAIFSIIIYLACSFLLYLILRRVSSSSYASAKPFPVFILSLLTAGFVLALGYHLFGIAKVFPLSPQLDVLFAPKQYFFWWFIAPLVGFFFLT